MPQKVVKILVRSADSQLLEHANTEFSLDVLKTLFWDDTLSKAAKNCKTTVAKKVEIIFDARREERSDA